MINAQSVLDSDSEWLERKAGTFVTLKKDDELRACIGTYLSTRDNVAEEVVANAIGAATRDHRFGAVEEEELAELSYEVQVLSEPQPITDKENLDPERYGIVVKKIPFGKEDVEIDKRGKSSVLLPGLEGIDTPEKQVSVALRKAGIMNEGKVKIWKFETEKYVHS